MRAVSLKEERGFLDEAAVEHGGGAVVDAVVELRAGRVEGEAEGAVAGKGVAAAGWLLGGKRLAGGEEELERADELRGVVGVDAVGGERVKAGEQAMEGGGIAGAEARAEGWVGGRCVVETVEQRAEVEAGAAGDDRQAPTGGDGGERLAGVAGPVAGVETLVGIDEVEEVVRDEGAVGGGGLGGADLHAAVHADGVAGEDFAREALGEAEGEVGFAGGGGADDGDEWF